jgi:hypothetical protein
MATSTRFEGRMNFSDIAAVRFNATYMSDAQLAFYFKVTKDPTLVEAHQIFLDEMAARVVDEYKDRLAYAQARNCL